MPDLGWRLFKSIAMLLFLAGPTPSFAQSLDHVLPFVSQELPTPQQSGGQQLSRSNLAALPAPMRQFIHDFDRSYGCSHFNSTLKSAVTTLLASLETPLDATAWDRFREEFGKRLNKTDERSKESLKSMLEMLSLIQNDFPKLLQSSIAMDQEELAELLTLRRADLSWQQRAFSDELSRLLQDLSLYAISSGQCNKPQAQVKASPKGPSQFDLSVYFEKTEVNQRSKAPPLDPIDDLIPSLGHLIPQSSFLLESEPEASFDEESLVLTQEPKEEEVPPPPPPPPPSLQERLDEYGDILDSVTQDASCRKHSYRNARRMAFLLFERYIKRKKKANESIDPEMIDIFSKRLGYMNYESSGGNPTRVYSHTKNPRTGERHSTPDFSTDETTRNIAKRILKTTGQRPTNAAISKAAQEVAWFYSVNPVDPKAFDGRFAGVTDRDIDPTTGRSFERREAHGLVSNLKLYREASKGESIFGIVWDYQTNFGILQQSTNRTYIDSHAFLFGDRKYEGHIKWLRDLVAAGRTHAVMNYCRSHDFFTDPLESIEKEIKSLANDCPASKVQPKRSQELLDDGLSRQALVRDYMIDGNMAFTKENVSCFGRWMMLCPGMNFDVAVNNSEAFYSYSNTRRRANLLQERIRQAHYSGHRSNEDKGFLCRSSFEDILKKHRN